mgnify:CR=1 FL=1
MKKLFAILLVTILTSCVTVLDPPKSNTDYKNIIGKPIKIGNIEVAQYDFPVKMNWEDAKKACEALGDGWRLPTLFELNILYKNKVKIGGFIDGWYCSSGIMDLKARGVWVGLQNFNDGKLDFYNKNEVQSHVRAVRAL